MKRTTIVLEVLSEESLPNVEEIDTLHWLLTECNAGDYVLAKVERTELAMNDGQMARALIAAGSEPAFFGLDEQ